MRKYLSINSLIGIKRKKIGLYFKPNLFSPSPDSPIVFAALAGFFCQHLTLYLKPFLGFMWMGFLFAPNPRVSFGHIFILYTIIAQGL